MNRNTADVDQLLNMVRQLINTVKDVNMPDEVVNDTISKLLVGLDQVMSRIDGNQDKPKNSALINKMEIDPPKKPKSRKKKA